MKLYKQVLGRKLVSFSWIKTFVFWLTAKSANRQNYQNGFCLRGMQLRYLLDEHVQISYGRTLMVKYCKTGVRERTLLESWFAMACGLVCMTGTMVIIVCSNFAFFCRWGIPVSSSCDQFILQWSKFCPDTYCTHHLTSKDSRLHIIMKIK